MNALSVTNLLASKFPLHTAGVDRHNVAHCKPVVKPRQHLGRQLQQQLACSSISTEAAVFEELHTCISRDTPPAGFNDSDAATCGRAYMTVSRLS